VAYTIIIGTGSRLCDLDPDLVVEALVRSEGEWLIVHDEYEFLVYSPLPIAHSPVQECDARDDE
jgi:hypothetical protein